MATHEQFTTTLNEALGEEQLSELTRHGAEMEFTDAVALARAELDRVIDGSD